MKSQAARVVVMRSVAARLVFAFRHWDQQSILDSAQKAAPSICGLRSSKSIRTGPAGAVLRRLQEERCDHVAWPMCTHKNSRITNGRCDEPIKPAPASVKQRAKNSNHTVVGYVSRRE